MSATTPAAVTLVPVEPNVSPAWFEREREAIFRRVWLKIGREEELPSPGDWLVRDLAVAGVSLLVVRGADGVVRAFHNVCRHRGNRVARGCRGSGARSFFCGFHGWTYDTAGRLAHVPLEQDFGGLRKEQLGLAPVALETWQGFLFVHLGGEPRETLAEHLGEVAERVRGFPFGEMELAGRWTADVESNWKTFQDAFVEAYHVATVHRRSIPDYRRSPLPARLETLGRHGNLTFYLDVSHEPAPAESWAYRAGSLAFLRSDGSETARRRRPAGVNRERRPDWIFDEFLIFPNFHLFVGDGWMLCHDFWPVSADRTDWTVSYYLERTDSPAVWIAQEYSKVTMRDTIREDLSTIESTHAAQRSGALTHMVLSPALESLVVHHHEEVARWVEGEAPRGRGA